MAENSFGTGLTPLQLRAVRAILSERTRKAAAAQVGVSTVTLWRWQKQPAFHAALKAGIQAQIDAVWRDIQRRQNG
ncbi:MAG: hypothetical protein FOGNACKC_01977 [Anaerolineae bacterium]|nr:hypothetical protein [Anaerolineae bacterium]